MTESLSASTGPCVARRPTPQIRPPFPGPRPPWTLISCFSNTMDAEFGAAHLSRGISRLSSEVLAEGRGSYVFTSENRKLLDMTCGIGVVNLGHCHPGVTRAAQEQCGKITHAQLNMGYSKPMLELIKELLTIMPDPKLDTFFFWNSGAEAVEASIKVARSVTRRQNVIVMQGTSQSGGVRANGRLVPRPHARDRGHDAQQDALRRQPGSPGARRV